MWQFIGSVSESDTGYDRQRTGNSGRKRTIKTYENEGRRIMKFMNVFLSLQVMQTM